MGKSSRRKFLKQTAALGLLHATTSHRFLGKAIAEPTAEAWPASPFLKGNFAPVTEQRTIDGLRVTGTLPKDLEGMFVRNGPNPQFPPKGKYHWFDGDGMLHGVYLAGGKASYRNRYIETDGLKRERRAGKALWTGLAEPIDINQLFAGRQPLKNAANTALVWHDGRLLALWEGDRPYEIRVPDLTTKGIETFENRLRHPFTAHPKIDPVTGEMVFFGYSFFKPFLQHSIVNPEGTLTSTTPIELPQASLMHDFAITERYSIFMDLPQPYSMQSMMSPGSTPPQATLDRPSRFGILPRHGQGEEIRWFTAPPCFVFHTLNAFEEGDEVVLDACRMARFPDVLTSDDDQVDPFAVTDDSPRLHRWRFNLTTGETHEERLDDLATDFPRLNDQQLGRRARFGYTATVDMTRLVKYDLKSGDRVIHNLGPGRTGGEGVFVARREGQTEDDGWVLTYVYDAGNQQSELVVVDARDFAAPPIARVHVPARIPYGFHGTWIWRDQIEAA